MSKKALALAIAILAVALLILVPDVTNALLAFIFIGIIPGTDISLPMWAMGLFIIITAAIAITWLSSQSLYIGDRVYQQKQAKASARDYVLEKVSKSPAKKSTPRTRSSRRTSKQDYQVATSSS